MKVKDWELDFSTKVGDKVRIIGTNTIGTILEKKEGTNTIETEDKELLEVEEEKTRKAMFFYLDKKE